MKRIIALAIVLAISSTAFAKGGGGGGHGGGGHASSGHSSSGHSSSSGGHTTAPAKSSPAPSKSAAAPTEPSKSTSWFPWWGGSHGGGTHTEKKCDKTKDVNCK